MTHGGNVWQGDSPAAWLDFSANLRPEGAPEWVREAMLRALDETRFYPDIAMHEAKQGIARYAGVEEHCVLPCAGGIAAIDLLCRAQSGRVLTSNLVFCEYARRAIACGRAVCYGTDAQMCPGDTFFVCNPNNPTGKAQSREEILGLYTRAKAIGATLVVDEAFVDFCPGNSVRPDAARTNGLLVTGSLTKALCVPGVRLGYLVADAETIAQLEALSAPWGLNAFAVAIARALPEHADEIKADATRNAQRRARMCTALVELGANVYPSEANFLLVDFGKSMRIASEELKKQGILVRDCVCFGLSDAHLRLAVKTDAQNDRLIDALKGMLP